MTRGAGTASKGGAENYGMLRKAPQKNLPDGSGRFFPRASPYQAHHNNNQAMKLRANNQPFQNNEPNLPNRTEFVQIIRRFGGQI